MLNPPLVVYTIGSRSTFSHKKALLKPVKSGKFQEMISCESIS